MLKSYSDWKSVCSKKEFAGVIGFLGEERALIEEAVATLRQDILQGSLDFDYDKVSAKNLCIARILDLANLLPMLAKKRLIEVDDAEALATEELEGLESFFTLPNPSTVLVFKFNKVDARNKLIKLFEKHGFAFNFEHPRFEHMPKIIMDRGPLHGLTIDHEVAQLIAMETGTSLLLLERALEKLALSSIEGRVTPNDVDEQVSQVQMQDAFALAKAVAIGDRVKAERFLAELELSHEIPLRLVGVLAWQLRQVLKARLLIDKGLNERDIGKELSLYGDRLWPVLTTARKWRREIHVLRLSRLCQLDRELKSSRARSWHLLEKTIMQLCPSTLDASQARKGAHASI